MKDLTSEQKTAVCEMATYGPVAVFEFRSEKIDSIKFFKKDKDGKPTSEQDTMVKHEIGAEFAGTGEQITLEVYQARGVEVKPVGCQRGEMFVGVIRGLKSENFKMSARVSQVVALSSIQSSSADPSGPAEQPKVYNLGAKAKTA